MTGWVQVRHGQAAFQLDVSFSASDGVTALFGRSGAGKTTVVNAVAGLMRPDAARISLGERVLVDTSAGIWVPPHRRRVGYVFQDARLFPHLSVARNLTYAQRFLPDSTPATDQGAVVDMLGIGHLLQRGIADLSGGEAQRVAIGRALLSAPELLLLDEPLAALDQARKDEILPYLEHVRDQADVPILYVSHQISEIARLATDVVVLEDGAVRTSGSVADVLSDLSAVAATGVREAGAVIVATVAAHHSDGLTEAKGAGATIWLPKVAAPVGAPLRLRIEAQDIMLSKSRPDEISALNILPVEIIALRQGDGPGVMVQLKAGDARLLARVTQRSAKGMALAQGWTGYAVVKSVAVASGDVGIGPSPGHL